jgi:gamma-glutamylcyclotransferase (GGCT)/AIG2-like uncharacterized protein YtfP
MFYFAYGSNMNWQQMHERCPSARFFGIAELQHHKLAFTRKSKNRGCGVADAVSGPGQKLWGVVYEVTTLDIEKLDNLEGYAPAGKRAPAPRGKATKMPTTENGTRRPPIKPGCRRLRWPSSEATKSEHNCLTRLRKVSTLPARN